LPCLSTMLQFCMPMFLGTITAQLADDCLICVRTWLENLVRPADLSDSEYVTFVRYCMSFFIHSNKLWCKDAQGQHKLVATPSSQLTVLRAAHDDVAHKGFYATNSFISLRFWWPHMRADITGSLKPVDFANFDKRVMSLFHLPSLRLRHYSPRYTQTPCIYQVWQF